MASGEDVLGPTLPTEYERARALTFNEYSWALVPIKIEYW